VFDCVRLTVSIDPLQYIVFKKHILIIQWIKYIITLKINCLLLTNK